MDTKSSTNLEVRSSSNASDHKAVGGYAGTPATKQQVLNPQEIAYATFEKAWKAGYLNPHEGDASGRYFNIGMAYSNECKVNSDYYAVREGRYIRHT